MSILYSILPRTGNAPRWLIFAIDVALCIASYIAAVFLRFNFFIGEPFHFTYFYPLPFVLAIRILLMLYFRIYAGIIRHTSVQDAIRVFYTITFSTILITVINATYTRFTADATLIPISVIIIDYFGAIILINSFRLVAKIIYMQINRPDEALVTNFAIFGAGEAGIIAKRKMEQFGNRQISVVAFFDDNPKKYKNYVDGVSIYSGTNDIETIVKKLDIKELIISPQDISKNRKQEIIELCLELDIKVRNVPPVERWINGELSFNQIKSVKIEDLIDRDEIVLDKGAIAQKLFNKTVLITGAAGSIGSEIVRQIVNNFKPKKLVLVDKSEVSLYLLDAELNTTHHRLLANTIDILVGDITHANRMEAIFQKYKPDVVYHAAAYKHVPLMEKNPCEAIRVNVGGTKMIADLAVKHGAEKFVMVSTDKAVNPTNVMGASKRIAEIYIQSLSSELIRNGQTATKFITTRFGNVLGSSGSVIPRFRKQIEEGGPITVTHPDITRFFMTIPEACQLVLEAGNMGKGGEIYIFDMGKAVKIIDLARKMIQLSGLKLGEDIQIVFTGLRPGEKIKEELLADEENTLTTYHPKIMIAKVRTYDFEWMSLQINALIALYSEQNNERIVSKMKEIVPEFLSKNSIYEALDYRHRSSDTEVSKHSTMN